ncbi:bacillithiol biosynthesis cysteine-adding enzyme BshC [Anditalea andensis]|uniref:Putative cysteine ligase BshC n=1 Tax=Anditalea andensis TaxID=1048983 RepID=A0A074KYK8_9BACT|nr:bacillithiol biosynthesis cysteine-adding enzyme BshC [Anditalea andensis]KEO73310.1 bacillithiol biosynthesis cysteine-adding enzyme BshC [Anditalea andensis]
MQKTSIDPDCTGQFSTFFLDYIYQKENLKPFYKLFPKIENFKQAIRERSFPQQYREVLAGVLENQYAEAGLESTSIGLLRESNTFTVTTGHQLNLMTGPLYFIYKIVSTINLAERLKREYPDFNFVPIYWMATEDHDFAEINHFQLDGEKYIWDSTQKGAVGEFEIDENLKQLIKNNRFIPDFFKAAYLESKNLGEAVLRYVNHLFGEKGLVVVDGNHRDLKRLFVPVIQSDLLEKKANDLVQKSTASLETLGYKSQIHPREINFFYLDKGLRERIVQQDGHYQITNTDLKFSWEEIERMIESTPEKFSPNVVMRPLYQETILPNLAYLGGPAEVVYWLQLKEVFDFYGTDFPMLMPRNFAMVIDTNTKRKIKSLGLTHQEIFQDFVLWKKQYIEQHSKLDVCLVYEKEKINEVIEHMKKDVEKVDMTLQRSVESMKVRIDKIINHFSKKIRRAEERNYQDSISKMIAIHAALFPKEIPQERFFNFLQFYLADENFLQQLHDLFDPLDYRYIILESDGKEKRA